MVNGKLMCENCEGMIIVFLDVIKFYDVFMLQKVGFFNLKGNLFESVIMKISVILEEFCNWYLFNLDDFEVFEGWVIVFEGFEDYYDNIDNLDFVIDEYCMLFICGIGLIGYLGGVEVVNMQLLVVLIKWGIILLLCIGDGC